METLERHSDSIYKLTSLVSKMNVKMDKKETPYKPRVYQGRPRGKGRSRQQNFQAQNRSFSRDGNRNRGNYNSRNNNRTNYRDRFRDDYRCDNKRNSYQCNDRQNNYQQDSRRRDSYRQDNRNGQNYRRNDSREDTEIGVKVEIDQEIIGMAAQEVETETEMNGCNKDPELCQMTEKDLDPNPIQE